MANRNFDFGTPFQLNAHMPTSQQFFTTPPEKKNLQEHAKRDPNKTTVVYNYNIKVSSNSLEQVSGGEAKPKSLSFESNNSSSSSESTVTNDNSSSINASKSNSLSNNEEKCDAIAMPLPVCEQSTSALGTSPIQLSFDLSHWGPKKEATKVILRPEVPIATPVAFNFSQNTSSLLSHHLLAKPPTATTTETTAQSSNSEANAAPSPSAPFRFLPSDVIAPQPRPKEVPKKKSALEVAYVILCLSIYSYVSSLYSHLLARLTRIVVV
jgi:hypothetical protein